MAVVSIWHGLPLVAVLCCYHFEYAFEFCQGFLSGRHQGIATPDRRDLRYPAFRLIPVQNNLVIIEAHASSILRRWIDARCD